MESVKTRAKFKRTTRTQDGIEIKFVLNFFLHQRIIPEFFFHDPKTSFWSVSSPRSSQARPTTSSQPIIMLKKVAIWNWAMHWACFVVWGMWTGGWEGRAKNRQNTLWSLGIVLMFIFSFFWVVSGVTTEFLCPEPLRDTCGPGRVYRPTEPQSLDEI